MNQPNRTPLPPNNIAVAKAIKLLMNPEGVTLKDIIEESGMHITTVRIWVRTLAKEGVIHITDWGRDDRNRAVAPMWTIGEKRNARRPGPRSGAERNAAVRARKRIQRDAQLLGIAA